MESRDIVSSDGIIVGTLSLPEGTPEEVWQEQLSMYSITTTVEEEPESPGEGEE